MEILLTIKYMTLSSINYLIDLHINYIYFNYNHFRNALRSVKVGGTVVYSTCTLSPLQNESVVENACAIVKRNYGIVCIEKSLNRLKGHLTSTGLYKFNDQCKRGILVVPFLPSNFGPMYVCKIMRQQ